MGLSDIELRTNFLISKLDKLYTSNATFPQNAIDLNSLKTSRVLIVAPHPDDEVIGCGGFIQKCLRDKAHVVVLFLTKEGDRSLVNSVSASGVNIRINESIAAQQILGYHKNDYLGFDELSLPDNIRMLIDRISHYIVKINPALILAPNCHDFHKDHEAACVATLKAVQKSAEHDNQIRILLYEVWGPCHLNAYYCLDRMEIERKMESLNCYKSQLASVDYQKIMAHNHQFRCRNVFENLHPENADTCWVEGYESLADKKEITKYLSQIENPEYAD